MTESVKFSIYLNDLFRCDEQGKGGASIPTVSLQVPAGVVNGSRVNLEELIGRVGPGSIKMDWYSRATGSVSDHNCWATQVLWVGGDAVAPLETTSGVEIPPAVVWRSSEQPLSGGPIDGAWVPMEGSANRIVRHVYSFGDCDGGDGSGCGCRFEANGGWANAVISVRVDIEVMVPTKYTTKEGMTTDGIPTWVWWTIGVIVTLLIIAVLAGLGYYFMRKKKGAKAMKQAAINAPVSASVANINAVKTQAQINANLAAKIAAAANTATKNISTSALNTAANLGASNVANATGLHSFY